MSISRSPQRGSFGLVSMIARAVEQGDDDLAASLESLRQAYAQREQNPDWIVNNLEYDLRSTDWIVAKARASESYAQNIYAALCNTEWQKVRLPDTPENIDRVLVDGYPKWHCSWRSAGGIVADLRGEGDYIDWYCSGSSGQWQAADESTSEVTEHYVAEGVVTDEILADFSALGWRLVSDSE